jgi:hypothetical protein
MIGTFNTMTRIIVYKSEKLPLLACLACSAAWLWVAVGLAGHEAGLAKRLGSGTWATTLVKSNWILIGVSPESKKIRKKMLTN